MSSYGIRTVSPLFSQAAQQSSKPYHAPASGASTTLKYGQSLQESAPPNITYARPAGLVSQTTSYQYPAQTASTATTGYYGAQQKQPSSTMSFSAATAPSQPSIYSSHATHMTPQTMVTSSVDTSALYGHGPSVPASHPGGGANSPFQAMQYQHKHSQDVVKGMQQAVTPIMQYERVVQDSGSTIITAPNPSNFNFKPQQVQPVIYQQPRSAMMTGAMQPTQMTFSSQMMQPAQSSQVMYQRQPSQMMYQAQPSQVMYQTQPLQMYQGPSSQMMYPAQSSQIMYQSPPPQVMYQAQQAQMTYPSQTAQLISPSREIQAPMMTMMMQSQQGMPSASLQNAGQVARPSSTQSPQRVPLMQSPHMMQAQQVLQSSSTMQAPMLTQGPKSMQAPQVIQAPQMMQHGSTMMSSAEGQVVRAPQTQLRVDDDTRTVLVSQQVQLPSNVMQQSLKRSSPICVGETIPPAHIDLHGVCVNLQEFFEDRSGVIIGLTGAFHPLDTKEIVPSILNARESFDRLVDFVGCLVVNDPFVVKAWAKHLGVSDQFTFVADSDAKFTEALGMSVNLPEEGLGLRSRRFAAVVGPRARIRWIGFDEDARAENLLRILPRYVRTPWKSYLVGVGSRPSAPEKGTEAEDISCSLHSMRALLNSQGFCSEGDWQLWLSDTVPDVFRPTTENILSGLRWLVEGSQAGDVLCFYYCGPTASFVDENGEEKRAILPMDHATSGSITEEMLYETLAPHVPEFCRLTIILDCIGEEESLTCPMPYVYSSSEKWGSDRNVKSELKGEILVVRLNGRGATSPGLLSELLLSMNPQAEEEGNASAPMPPVSYREMIEQINERLRQSGVNEKYLQLESSVPLNPNDEFTISDILVQP